jgi:hypothetical protein
MEAERLIPKELSEAVLKDARAKESNQALA